MTWIFALLSLAMALAGGVAIVIGWPLVPLERGWTMVIAGSVGGSAGIVCLLLVKLLWETSRMRLALERALNVLPLAGPAKGGSPTTPSATTACETPNQIPPAVRHAGKPMRLTPPNEGSAVAPYDLEELRTFAVGETTFAVFSDGSIEARTSGGVRRFASMREVRTYLELARADEAP
jgi:hypothetical protein